MGDEGLNQLSYIFKELKNNMTQSRGNKSNDSELKNFTDGIETRKMELDVVLAATIPALEGEAGGLQV